ncbi:ankyrin repeat and SOCS box protein 10 [Scomber scombrus]|uniref:ankyrin repeat and SOCS box protein 10 n=1 Tax=Scomber scombrus TaxID=13677 RepID=UPI002DDA2DF9|nr:ankyrin repeat and SOCS box protein 10 [Scomber scombrus]
MAYVAPKVKWHKPKAYRNDVIATAKATGCILQYWNSLLVGDELTVLSIVDDNEYVYLVDAIFDTSNIDEWKNFRFNYRGLILSSELTLCQLYSLLAGLWSLTYEQELTTPLHITASRGFTDCLRLLLQRGADVKLAPGGTTALHESCENCHPECTKLLLMHGANPSAVSEEGLMPLHVCSSPESLECAKYLLQYGAAINGCTVDEEDTPLHTAARCGLLEHIELYLSYGAAVNRKNQIGLTPLNTACSQRQEVQDLERYFKLCQMLLGAGSDIHTMDQDRHTPLHMACKNANPDIVDMLLANGAYVNDMDYGGEAPMHNILKEVCFKVSHHPERIVRSLLNYGSIRVWPGALPKVLAHCCVSPDTIEVLLNVYSHLKVNDTWVESVSEEVFKENKEFYESLFSLARTPRSLQHLARCNLRTFLEGRVHKVVPKLDLPTFIKNYLLLECRGYVH